MLNEKNVCVEIRPRFLIRPDRSSAQRQRINKLVIVDEIILLQPIAYCLRDVVRVHAAHRIAARNQHERAARIVNRQGRAFFWRRNVICP